MEDIPDVDSFTTPVTELNSSVMEAVTELTSSVPGNVGKTAELEGILGEHLQALQRFISINQRLHTKLASAGLVVDMEKASKPKIAASTRGRKAPAPPAPTTFLPGSIGDEEVEDLASDDILFQTRVAPPTNDIQTASAPNLELAPIMPVADSCRQPTGESDNREIHQAPELHQQPAASVRSTTVPLRPAGSKISMSDHDTMDFLSKVGLFKRVPQEMQGALCHACEEVEFAKGDVLIRQGDVGDEFFMLMTGRVSVIIDTVKVSVLAPGDYFGENALLKNESRTATVMAESDKVMCLRLSRHNLEELGLSEALRGEFRTRQTVGKSHNAVFADAAAMKEKLRVQMAKPPYDVRNFYHDKGVPQKIARSQLFDTSTITIIAINAIWISVDTDWNTADVLIDAEPVFIAAENLFCFYFSFEWLTRYLSFRRKRCGIPQDGLKDYWFLFDSMLVFTMVMETWIMNAIVLAAGSGGGGGVGNASILRLFRLLRLSRMARMARLLRAMPELMVLIKGMAVAMRSVIFTLILLAGIIYIFAIAFKQLMKDTPAGDVYFPNVGRGMNSLLLDGVLPDQAQIITDVGDEHWAFRIMILLYILLASLTVMNMLVGVLCEVVSVVSSVEQESLLVNYVKGTLLHMLQTSGLDADHDNLISKPEFEALLENPGAAKALSEVGVDVIGLVDFTDFIFKDGRELSFPDFMEMVLQLRGSNTATVKDLIDLRKLVLSELDKLGSKYQEVLEDKLTSFMGHGPSEYGSARHSLDGAGTFGSGSFGPLRGSPSQGCTLAARFVEPQKAPPQDLQGLSWAAAASIRLTAAATELSAAAGELSIRNRTQQKALQE